MKNNSYDNDGDDNENVKKQRRIYMNISISMNIVLLLDCKKMVGDEIIIVMMKFYKYRLGFDWMVCYYFKEVVCDEI